MKISDLKQSFSKLQHYSLSFLILFFFLFLGKCLRFSTQTFGITGEWSSALEIFTGQFLSDTRIFLIILSSTLLSSLCKKRLRQLFWLLAVAGVFLCYGAEEAGMIVLSTTVSLPEMVSFLGTSSPGFTGLITGAGISLFLLFCGIMIIISIPKIRKKLSYGLLLVVLLQMSSTGYYLLSPTPYTLPDNLLQRTIQAFSSLEIPLLSTIATGIPTADQTENPPLPHTHYEEYFTTEKGKGQQLNLIIVFAESLSQIDSLRVGGVNDRLPNFDAIAEKGITFTNYINNGCTSDTAHNALLKGVFPRDVSGYQGFHTPLESLPTFLHNQGYHTTFLSTAPLNFLDQRAFLEEMQFDQIIGEEKFSGKKYTFDAAPDGELYHEALKRIRIEEILQDIKIKERKKPEPYAIMMQTISYHKPYNTPYGKDESTALAYSDEMLGSFYEKLEAEHFFDKGILLIVSDHRKMNALEKGEKEALGEFRYAKGLVTIVGKNIKPHTLNSTLLQHSDLYYGLRKLIASGSVINAEIYNDPFSGKTGRDRAFLRCGFLGIHHYSLIMANGSGFQENNIPALLSHSPSAQQYLSLYLQYQIPPETAEIP
ncbi:MAG: LTA synthase family protein [Candidatus Peribacteria bacterium]|jgi:glucan phosphoethanolaminetransferase (alkaline phosphatase superfamily)|nr:LTA synthase family protein [Candidatus Peribacteria bacterium]